MNYLELAQKLRRKCRVSGNGPTSVTGQNEEYNRLLDWTNEAWLYIQRLHTDWQWMRNSATAVTVEGQHLYSPTTDFSLTDFGYWALDYAQGDTFRNYVTSVGPQSEIFMTVVDNYDIWRDRYLYGALRYAYSRPVELAIAPNGDLAVGPVPIAGYTLSGDYYSIPTEMVDATDVPDMPEQFHWAIIYKAMMFYGASEAAPEVYDDGAEELDKIVAQLRMSQLRRAFLGGSL